MYVCVSLGATGELYTLPGLIVCGLRRGGARAMRGFCGCAMRIDWARTVDKCFFASSA